ncbi:MAG: hypothetical protein IT381_12125 [Deltaproteobacteria bacterium]|nr:hypothetical protein [Deltaproteobacteria bacterium]
MKRLVRCLFLVILCTCRPATVDSVADFEPNFPPDVNTLQVKEGVEGVTDETTNAAVVRENSLEFPAASANEVLTWSPGRIVVSGGGTSTNPLGFARKVVSVEEKGGLVIVKTEPVGLEDMFAAGELGMRLDNAEREEVDLGGLDPKWVDDNYHAKPTPPVSKLPVLTVNAGGEGGPARDFWDDPFGTIKDGITTVVDAISDVAQAALKAGKAVLKALLPTVNQSAGGGFTFWIRQPETSLIKMKEYKKEVANGRMELTLNGGATIEYYMEVNPGVRLVLQINYEGKTRVGVQLSAKMIEQITMKAAFEAEISGIVDNGTTKMNADKVKERLENDIEFAQEFLAEKGVSLLGDEKFRVTTPIAKKNVWTQEKPYKITFYIPIPKGRIPVTITVQQQVDLICELTAQGSLEATFSIDRIDKFEGGAYFDLDQGFVLEKEHTVEKNEKKFEVQSSAKAAARCGMIPRVNVRLYDFVGVYAGLYGSLYANASYETRCASNSRVVDADVELEAGAELELQVGGTFKLPVISETKDFGERNISLAKKVLYENKFTTKGLGYCAPTCTNKELDDEQKPPETDVDCGGGACATCKFGQACAKNTDCGAGLTCVDDVCTNTTCGNKVRDGLETALDCGGGCAGCALGENCGEDADCESGACHETNNVCVADSCSNGRKDEGECATDCGGTCSNKCEVGDLCKQDRYCASGVSNGTNCVRHSCENRRLDPGEADLDCGTAPNCTPCRTGSKCSVNQDCATFNDCISGVCVFVPPTCSDKIRNQDEVDADCGGVCLGDRSSSNTKSCGLYCAGACGAGRRCSSANDCANGDCVGGTCSDKVAVALVPWSLSPEGNRVNASGFVTDTTSYPTAQQISDAMIANGFASGAPETVQFVETVSQKTYTYPDASQKDYTNLVTRFGGMFLPGTFQPVSGPGGTYAKPVLGAGSFFGIKFVPQAPGGLACGVFNGYMGGFGAAYLTNPAIAGAPVIPFRCRPAREVAGNLTGVLLEGVTLTNTWKTTPVGSVGWNYGADDISMTQPGRIIFPIGIAQGATYEVSVKQASTQLACSVTNPRGEVGLGNVGNITVDCQPKGAYVHGTVTGLDGPMLGTVTVTNNGSNPKTMGDGSFDFGVIPAGSPYNVAATNTAAGVVCTVSGGAGTAPQSAVVNVTITCSKPLSVGGTISGLATGTVQIELNGGGRMTLGNGPFTFGTTVNLGDWYSVTTAQDPDEHTCDVIRGGGQMTNAVTDVEVKCAQKRYLIFAKISGLGNAPIRQEQPWVRIADVQNAGEPVQFSRDSGGLTFPLVTTLPRNTNYELKILASSSNRKCTFPGQYSGVLDPAPGLYGIEVDVGCVDASNRKIRGVLSGATGKVTVRSSPNGLHNFYQYVTNGCSGSLVRRYADYNSDILDVNTNGNFVFPTSLKVGDDWGVTLQSAPDGQTCTITPASGTVANVPEDVTVYVTCTDVPTYEVRGTLSGNTGPVVLSNNLTNELTVAAPGPFTFTKRIGNGLGYAVTVHTHPAGQFCTPTTNTGTIAAADVTNVSVTCVDVPTHSVSGVLKRVVGLSGATGMLAVAPTGNIVLQNNDGDNLTVADPVAGSDMAFTFATKIAEGLGYRVTVFGKPSDQRCEPSRNVGSIGTSDVGGVEVRCWRVPSHSVTGELFGANGQVVLTNNGADVLTLTQNGEFTFAQKIPEGDSYKVELTSWPAGQDCGIEKPGGVMGQTDGGGVIVRCKPKQFTIAANVSGLGAGDYVALDAGQGILPRNANGPATLPGRFNVGDPYAVKVVATRVGIACTVPMPQGTVGLTPVVVAVNCGPAAPRTVGGTMSATPTSPAVLALVFRDQREELPVQPGALFTFGSTVYEGENYAVSVHRHPEGYTCSVAPANGTVGGANVDVAVTCSATPAYTVRGTVSGATGAVILANRGDEVSTPNGSFAFSRKLVAGASYDVSVVASPANQRCVVTSGGAGVMPGADYSGVVVTCTTVPLRTIGGRFESPAGTVFLFNNGGDTLSVPANSEFTFATALPDGTDYEVTVAFPPLGQRCDVLGGSRGNGRGTASAASAGEVFISCSPASYHQLGGTIAGASGNVTLRNFWDGQQVTHADGTYQLASDLPLFAPYWLYVVTQPSGQRCTVANSYGWIVGANVNNVNVTCANVVTHPIGGTLSGAGGAVTLRNSGGDDLVVGTNGSFTFATEVAEGALYDVTVFKAPAGQTCHVTNGTKILGVSAVSDITVTCTSNSVHTVGGSVIYLGTATITLRNNGGDDITLDPLSGPGWDLFTFPTPVGEGLPYAVTVFDPPDGEETCDISGGENGDGTGDMLTTDVSDIFISCYDSGGGGSTVGGTITGLGGGETVTLKLNALADQVFNADGSYALTGSLTNGTPYAVQIIASPPGKYCFVVNESGTMGMMSVTNVNVTCSSGTAKRVFLTQAFYPMPAVAPPDGYVAAEAFCNLEKGGLTGNFKPWLSTDSINAVSVFTSPNPYHLPNSTGGLGPRVVPNAAMFSQTALMPLEHAIDRNAAGLTVSDYTSVWTGTLPDGTEATTPSNCFDWTYNLSPEMGQSGDYRATDGTFTDSGASTCTEVTLRLYCLEE